MAWCGPPRKARDRKVEAPPEEMDGARLAEEGGTEMCENFVHREEYAQEATSVIAIVSSVLIVLIEGNGISDLARRGRDPHVQPEFGHCGKQLGIELGDRRRPEQELAEIPVARSYPQHMVNKIEVDLKCAFVIGNWRGREATRRHVQRHLP